MKETFYERIGEAVCRERLTNGLEVCVVPGMVKCRDCGRVFNAMEYDMRCPGCEGQQMEILSGNDLMIKEILCK